jgi:ArsR family transcriptional regulator
MFKALGDPTRLRIFDYLRCCPITVDEEGKELQGPTVTDVCCSVLGSDKITSTLSFHLKELRQAGLITMERRGKNMVCGIDREALATLADYFGESGSLECC